MKKRLLLLLLMLALMAGCLAGLSVGASAADPEEGNGITEKTDYAVGDEVEFVYPAKRGDLYYLYCHRLLLDTQAAPVGGGEITFKIKLDSRAFKHGDYTFEIWHTNMVLLPEKLEEITLHIHTVELRPGTPATCTEPGMSDGKYCSDCDLIVEESQPTSALGHNWDHGDVVKAPTCTEKGERLYTCTRCGEEKLEEIPLKPHAEILDLPTAPTCTTPGRTGGKHCAVCEEVTVAQTEVSALGHNWDKGTVEKEATCTEPGRRHHVCARCGETKTEDIPTKAHMEAEDAAVAPTCTEKGKSAGKHCSVCGTVTVEQLAVSALGHDWDSGKVIKEATCTVKGEKTYTCARCGETKREDIPMKAHTEVKDAAVAPTCTEKGKTEGKHCSVCGKVLTEQKVVSALGHQWDEGKVTKEATAAEAGEKTLTCQRSDCTETKTELIPPLGEETKPEAEPKAVAPGDGKSDAAPAADGVDTEDGADIPKEEKRGSRVWPWLLLGSLAAGGGGFWGYRRKKK